jgi:hypothetical protein
LPVVARVAPMAIQEPHAPAATGEQPV